MDIEKALQIVIDEAERSIENTEGVSMAMNEALSLCKQLMSFISNMDENFRPQAPDYIPEGIPKNES